MDPYEVLGVPRGADEETIKKAYKNLVKKYHPDRYVNSPMADMASEKMKEINMAYDALTGKNQNTGNTGNAGGAYRGYYRGYTGQNGAPSFEAVRMLINMGQLQYAEAMLGGLPKDAQWYYLYGLIYMRKGWYEKAIEYIKRAAEMEPGNIEYNSMLNNIRNRNNGYTKTYRSSGLDNDCCGSCCRIIPCIICCNCC